MALVEDGDIIRIDVLARTIDLVIHVEELNHRAGAWVPPPLPLTKRHGVLAKYARNVLSTHYRALKDGSHADTYEQAWRPELVKYDDM